MDGIVSNQGNYGFSFLNEDGSSKFVFDEKVMMKSLAREVPKESIELSLNLLEALNSWFQIPKDIYDSLVAFESHQALMRILFEEISYPFEFDSQNLPYNLSDAINGYYYAHLKGLFRLETHRNKELRSLYYKKNREQFIRRGMLLHWSSNIICPTMDEYLNIIAKSWKFLDFNFEVMVQNSKFQEDTTKLRKTLSYLFCIDEELKDLISESTSEDDKYCGAITRGQFTFPVIHAINNSTEYENKLRTILNLRTQNINVKKYFFSLLEKCGSIEATKNSIKYLATEAMAEVKRIGKNPVLEKILSKYTE